MLLAGGARAELCWPPVFEGGRRLQQRFEMPVNWLPLLLRQHEVCWREPRHPDELRVFMTGSSGIYGFPLPVEHTFQTLLDAKGEERRPRVRYFNLGHPFTYQIKDALILRAALRFEPDLIVHAVSLDDFAHLAPNPYPPVRAFLDGNRRAIAAFAGEAPPGLEEPLAMIHAVQREEAALPAGVENLRQAGRFVKLTADTHAEALRRSWLLEPHEVPPPGIPLEEALRLKRRARYDCAKTQRKFQQLFGGWQEWNILAYLEWLREARGVEVAVVNWPVAREPRGACYNVRFTQKAFAEYNAWLREQATARGLPLLDYHDLLEPAEFFDSLHPTREGHARLAEHLEADLADLLERAAR